MAKYIVKLKRTFEYVDDAEVKASSPKEAKKIGLCIMSTFFSRG